MGRAWVVCHPCLRFVELRVRDDRDTRVTTFSCCLCGSEGKLTFDDPAKQGLQDDPRPHPPRHPYRVLRLQQIARLHDPFGHRKAAREDLPQQDKPRHEPLPRYRLKPMPFRTLGEALVAGLVVKVYCPECRRHARPELPSVAHDRCFAKLVFRCRDVVQRWPTMPPRGCKSRGRLQLEPLERIPPNSRIRRVYLSCGRCGWEIHGVREDQPPWYDYPVEGASERYRCPGCGGTVGGQWHGGDATPGTEGYTSRPKG